MGKPHKNGLSYQDDGSHYSNLSYERMHTILIAVSEF